MTTGTDGNTPAFPAQWFYGLLRALLGEPACLPPSPARCVSIVARLTPAWVRQDHTTWPSARKSARLSAFSRPPQPASRVVTIAIRPSAIEAGYADNTVNPNFGKGENFYIEGLTGIRANGPSGKSVGSPACTAKRRAITAASRQADAYVRSTHKAAEFAWRCDMSRWAKTRLRRGARATLSAEPRRGHAATMTKSIVECRVNVGCELRYVSRNT